MRSLSFTCCLLCFLSASSAWAGDTKHWAFTPPKRPPIPNVKDVSLVAQSDRSLHPGAARKTGPAPCDRSRSGDPVAAIELRLDRFATDVSNSAKIPVRPGPAAYERLVERLLASPQYGERWGQHWLDLARFAETDGFEFDQARPDAWRYRDWVVDAFNRDLPYDQFVRFSSRATSCGPTIPGHSSPPGSIAATPTWST